MRKRTLEENIDIQQQKGQEPRIPVCVVLNDIRSLHNVGSIFRTADGAGIEKMWLCGITGQPPKSQIAKTALGAELNVPWEYREDPKELIHELRSKGYQIVLLEQTLHSCSYTEFKPTKPVCLVLGHEVEGVDDGLVTLCDQAVEIEMAGIKNSLNVSVAFGIIAYYLRHCLK